MISSRVFFLTVFRFTVGAEERKKFLFTVAKKSTHVMSVRWNAFGHDSLMK
jgi:hypothetical protein